MVVTELVSTAGALVESIRANTLNLDGGHHTVRPSEIADMGIGLIDTHTHLDSDEYANDLGNVIAASRANGVTRWINVGYSPARWETTLALVERFSGMSHMLGMHPGKADDWNLGHAGFLADLVERTRPVAIGEIGLDLYWRKDNLSRQVSAFREQLALAESVNIPAVIHMRNADSEMIDVLQSMPSLPQLHFHSFDGTERLRNWVENHQCTIGVGGLMTRKASESLRAWLYDVPKKQIVLETDSPWLKPQGIRGKRNEPAFLTRVADILAELWSMTRADVDQLTTANACRIFRFDTKDA